MPRRSRVGPGPRALVLEHRESAPAGLLGEWLDENGFTTVLRRPPEDGIPDAPGEFDMVASLGSDHGVGDGLDWIDAEIGYLKRCVAADVPVLGLCFGGQALAAALGSSVHVAQRGEVGWVELRDTREGFPAGPWFAFHFDAFEPPPGATTLGRTSVCPHAFRRGAHLGVQFHPEVTPAIVEDWVSTFPEKVSAAGAGAAEVIAQTRRTAAASRRRSFELFDRFWAGVERRR